MAKKLKTVLKEIDVDMVSIGGKDGSSYVYIGKPDLEKIDEMYEIYKKRLTLRLEDNKKKLIDVVKKGVDTSKDKEIKNFVIKIQKLKNAIDADKRYIDQYREPGDRIVHEVYDRAEGGVAILISGDEQGKFWTINETMK